MPQGPERRNRGPRKGGPRGGGSRSGGPRQGGPRKFSDNPNSGPRRPRREDESSDRRPRQVGDRPYRPRGEGERSGRPRRDGERPSRPRREGAGEIRRRSEGDRGPSRRSFGERSGERSARPRREFDRSARPRRDGDRPERPLTDAQRRADEIRRTKGGRKYKRGEVPYERPSEERWIDEGPVRPRKSSKRSEQEPVRQRTGEAMETVNSRALGPLSAALGERDGLRQARRLAKALEAFQAERWKDAKQILGPIAADAPEVAMVRELLGLSLYRMGDWLKAADHLEAARHLDRAQMIVHPVLADCYRALGRHEQVDAVWAELRDASPDAATVSEGRIVAANSLAERGNIQSAIRLMEKASKEPSRPQEHHLRTWYALADLYDKAGDPIKARNMFQLVKRYDKSFYDIDDRLRDLGR